MVTVFVHNQSTYSRHFRWLLICIDNCAYVRHVDENQSKLCLGFGLRLKIVPRLHKHHNHISSGKIMPSVRLLWLPLFK